MKIEISHDILARNIFDKASAEDKMRLKILNFIKGRYSYYIESTKKALLQKEDLNYIGPYLKQIELQQDEVAFIDKSKRRVFLRRVYELVSTAVLVTVLIVSLALVNWSRWSTERQRDIAENKTIELEKSKAKIEQQKKDLEAKEAERQRILESLEGNSKTLSDNKEVLKRTVEELNIKNAEVDKLNAELKRKNDLLNQKYAAVYNEKQEKLGELARAERKNQEISQANAVLELQKTQSDSRVLSAKALYELHQTNDPAEAFQMAKKAYEMDPTNKEACAVLDELMTKRKDYFERKDGPKTKTEDIIKALTPKYGSITKDIESKILKGQWPATLNKIK